MDQKWPQSHAQHPPNGYVARPPPTNHGYNHQGHYQQHGVPPNYGNQPAYAYQQQPLQHNIPPQQWNNHQQPLQQHYPQPAPQPLQPRFAPAMNPQPQYSPGAPHNFTANNNHHHQQQPQHSPQSFGAPTPFNSPYPPPAQPVQLQLPQQLPQQPQLVPQQPQLVPQQPQQQWHNNKTIQTHRPRNAPVAQPSPFRNQPVQQWAAAAAVTTAAMPPRDTPSPLTQMLHTTADSSRPATPVTNQQQPAVAAPSPAAKLPTAPAQLYQRQYETPPATPVPSNVDVSDYPKSGFQMVYTIFQKQGHNLVGPDGKLLIHRSVIRITDETAIPNNDKMSVPKHHHFISFCQYNPTHVMDSLEVRGHEKCCPDKKIIDMLKAL